MSYHRLILSWFILILLTCASTVQAISTGDQLIAFSAKDMEGNEVDLSTIIGKKPVMLIFWASWCPNCFREVPRVNGLKKQIGADTMAFIGINVGFNDSRKKARMFMKNSKMDYPVIFDEDHSITNRYRVRGVPTIVLANRQGKVIRVDFAVPEVSDELLKELTR